MTIKFVFEFADGVYPIHELDPEDFKSVVNRERVTSHRDPCTIGINLRDIVGAPVYCTNINGAWFFWPRPIPSIKVYKIDPWSLTDARLPS